MRAIYLFFCIVLSQSILAQSRLEFSPPLKQAYKKVLDLRFEEARSILTKVKKNDPQNVMRDYVENYIDILRVYLDEDKALFEELERRKKTRLKRIDTSPENSPYHDYIQAEILLQWAVVRAKFEDYTNAFFEVRRAYKLLEKNQRRYPDFIANKKSLGILHALVGSIPDQYKWGVRLLSGMDGTVAQGRGEIEEVLRYAQKNDFLFEEETIVMYALMMMHIGNRKDLANNVVGASKLDEGKSPLACFVKATVAMHSGQNDRAIQILENAPRGKQYFPFYFLDFMMGEAKLSRLDKDAGFYFSRYLNKFQGQNYIKEAYQKLAWHSLIQGKPARYSAYMKQCLGKGYAVIDGDKKAQRAAKSNKIPQAEILKARLLFDGGYYKRAKGILMAIPVSSLSENEQLEREYRLARCCQLLKEYTLAKQKYGLVIGKGRNLPYYYACKSALEMGRIFEKQKEKTRARQFYKQCLGMKPEEYRNGLHAQAKAGLNRLR